MGSFTVSAPHGRMRAARLLVAVALLAGCLGIDRTFPDESDQVRAVRVNAYEAVSGSAPKPAFVEVQGLDGDSAPHAFRGHVRVVLEEQHGHAPDGPPTYSDVKTFDVDVSPTDFVGGQAPMFSLRVDATTFPED